VIERRPDAGGAELNAGMLDRECGKTGAGGLAAGLGGTGMRAVSAIQILLFGVAGRPRSCAGSGGNSPRVQLWKVGLQKLADEAGLELELCHFPPGTSKWNKVEHRLFSFISLNWRGRPLESYKVILDLIASTTTSTGLKVYARLDPTIYTKGTKVTN
jgi:Rhodopirellula transposase DDE domain